MTGVEGVDFKTIVIRNGPRAGKTIQVPIRKPKAATAPATAPASKPAASKPASAPASKTEAGGGVSVTVAVGVLVAAAVVVAGAVYWRRRAAGPAAVPEAGSGEVFEFPGEASAG